MFFHTMWPELQIFTEIMTWGERQGHEDPFVVIGAGHIGLRQAPLGERMTV